MKLFKKENPTGNYRPAAGIGRRNPVICAQKEFRLEGHNGPF